MRQSVNMSNRVSLDKHIQRQKREILKSTSRTSYLVAAAVWMTHTACAPSVPYEDVESNTPDPSLNLTGSLTASGLKLSWQPGDQWDGGGCFKCTLLNQGAALDYWGFQLQMSGAFDLVWSGGAFFNAGDDWLFVGDSTEGLAANKSETFEYCAEPQVVPIELLDVQRVEPTPAPTPVPTPTPIPGPDDITPVLGSVKSGDIVLFYRTDGSSKGGTCLDMNLYNGTLNTLSAWKAKVNLDTPTSLTDYWGFLVSTTPSNPAYLEIYPGAGQSEIKAGQSVFGHICLKPLSIPVTMSIVITSNTSRSTLDLQPRLARSGAAR